MLFAGANLKVVFGDAQVHLGIANHGDAFLSSYLMAVVAHADILKRELLLVHGSRKISSLWNGPQELQRCSMLSCLSIQRMDLSRKHLKQEVRGHRNQRIQGIQSQY